MQWRKDPKVHCTEFDPHQQGVDVLFERDKTYLNLLVSQNLWKKKEKRKRIKKIEAKNSRLKVYCAL
jgi:hypothetical protein